MFAIALVRRGDKNTEKISPSYVMHFDSQCFRLRRIRLKSCFIRVVSWWVHLGNARATNTLLPQIDLAVLLPIDVK